MVKEREGEVVVYNDDLVVILSIVFDVDDLDKLF